jgi:hypothetical protein
MAQIYAEIAGTGRENCPPAEKKCRLRTFRRELSTAEYSFVI